MDHMENIHLFPKYLILLVLKLFLRLLEFHENLFSDLIFFFIGSALILGL